jgi:hypothetical protein
MSEATNPKFTAQSPALRPNAQNLVRTITRLRTRREVVATGPRFAVRVLFLGMLRNAAFSPDARHKPLPLS